MSSGKDGPGASSSTLDGMWGDWGKRFSESTKAFSSDLLQRVDEIKSTVQDAPSNTGTALPDNSAMKQLRLMQIENDRLRTRLVALEADSRQPQGEQTDPDAPVDVQRVAEMERELRKAQEREEAIRSQARSAVSGVTVENEQMRRALSELEATIRDLQDTAKNEPDGLRRKVSELEVQLVEKDSVLRALDSSAKENEEKLITELADVRNQLELVTSGALSMEKSAEESEESHANSNLIEELRAEVARLKGREEETATIVPELRAQITSLEQRLSGRGEPPVGDKSDAHERFSEENATLAKQLQETNNRVSKLKDDLAKSHQGHLATRKRLASAEEGANRAEKAAHDLSQKLSAASALSKEAEKKVAQKEAHLDDMSQTLKSFQDELEQSHKRVRDQEQRWLTMERNLRNQLHQAQVDERAASDAFRAVEARNVAIAEELDRALRTVADKAELLDSAEASLAEERGRKDELRGQLVTTQEEFRAYKERAKLAISEKDSQIRNTRVQMDGLEARIHELASTRSTNADVSDQGQPEGDRINSLIEELRQQLKGAEDQIRELRALAERKEIHLKKQQLELETLRADQRSLKAENDAQSHAAQRALLERDDSVQRAEVAEGALRDAQEQSEAQITSLKHKTESLQRELRRSRGGTQGRSSNSQESSLPTEYKLRAEQLERSVWQLRKENARLSSLLREMREKSDTVGSLMSL